MLDAGNREGLAIEIDTSLPSVRVVQVLDQLVALAEWCAQHGVVLQHIQPAKPNQSACIERFNKTWRTEVLDA